ncbi:LacI family DNA-binding transcriptional regulator [Vibrio sp. TH_r3]|uniref:LacI family DNA-binding transcriptional regulator n=1 Tax=Vibrio sp. TH_r3 TaxID=3082084 RepID=UPI002952E1E0|nr:LacI family DNA-binding transcriptional regulator [Vibrio sp. TH_r3]MDV7105095.1 LacI family DNA-binding transcriptional regulator [Vibrio sp. TH_r3]
MATITDVSLMANVSKATVSRVFSGNAKVKSETKQVVLRAAEQLGYNTIKTVDLLSRDLTNVAINTGSIGIIISQFSSANFSQFFLAAQHHAISLSKKLFLFNGESSSSMEKEYLKLLVEGGCEIIVLIETSLTNSDIGIFNKSKSHIISLANKNELSQLSLSYDHASASMSACNLLLANNHSDIAIFSGRGNNSINRIKGFKEAFSRVNINFDQQLIVDQTEDGVMATTKLCGLCVPFSAIITATDKMAAESMATLRQFNFEIPEHVSIISLEGSELAEYTYPRLTTVEIPVNLIASEVIDICNEYSKTMNWDCIKDRHLNGKLIMRESVQQYQPKSKLNAWPSGNNIKPF